jgi:hypothetical protein
VALRVADPLRVRLLGAALTATGVLWVPFTATQGPVSLLGLAPLALGVSAFDAANEGRLTHRQLGLSVIVASAGVAMWSFFVIFFMGAIGTAGASWVWYALLVVSTAVTLGGFVIRFRPLWIQGLIAAVIERSQSVKQRRSDRRGGEHRARARAPSRSNGRGFAARRAS